VRHGEHEADRGDVGEREAEDGPGRGGGAAARRPRGRLPGRPERNWHAARSLIAWIVAAVATVVGSTQLIDQWTEVLVGAQKPVAASIEGGSSAEINRDATQSSIQTVTGSVAQDNSRHVHLYDSAFRVEVVRATDDVSAPKARLRDEVLAAVEGLVTAMGEDDGAAAEQVRALGRRLGQAIESAPVSSYQLTGREFTLEPGKAWFLPGGAGVIALLGPAEPEPGDESAGAPEREVADRAITLMRHGRRVQMRIGSIRVFRHQGETCELILHEIAPGHASASFSYACQAA
jgi:hypothetical protein